MFKLLLFNVLRNFFLFTDPDKLYNIPVSRTLERLKALSDIKARSAQPWHGIMLKLLVLLDSKRGNIGARREGRERN